MYDCVLDPSAKTIAVEIIVVAILLCGGIWIAKIEKNKEIGQRVSLYIKRRKEEMGMVSLRFEEYEAVTIRLSKEAFTILQEMQRKGLSPDDAVDSMILTYDKEKREGTTLTLSERAMEILQELKRGGGSPDETVDSMILAFDKCQSKPNKGNKDQA